MWFDNDPRSPRPLSTCAIVDEEEIVVSDAPLVLLISLRPRVALPAAMTLNSVGYRTLVRPTLPTTEELRELAPWFIAVDATEWDRAPLGETIGGCPVVPLAFLESDSETPSYSYALN
jgi:hypothetical protein